MRRLWERYDLDNVTLHDMRRCIVTWPADKGTRPGVIELTLNHQPRDVTGRHYKFSRKEWWVRDALQRWADHVEALAVGRAAEPKVVLFQRA